MAQVLVVANRKGGTAKTTTVVNLAYSLTHAGYRVLVIDCDNQAQASHGFIPTIDQDGLQSPVWLNGVDYFSGTCTVSPRLMLCIPKAQGAQDSLQLNWLEELAFHPEVQGTFDYVLVDTPPTLGAVLMGAMAIADIIVIPAEPTPLASNGVMKLIGACKNAVINNQFRARQILLLPVMVDEQLILHRQILKEWIVRFGESRVLPFIRRNVKLAEAFLVNKPVQQYAPGSNGARDYQQLSENLMRFI